MKSSGIAAQAELAAAFEIFAAAAKQHFGGDLAGKLVASCGISGPIGLAPLGAAMNGAAALGIDGDAEQIKSLVKTGYCDVMVNDLDEALRLLKNAVRKCEPVAVGLVANYRDLIPAMARRGIVPDLLIGAALDFEGVNPLQKLGTIGIAWNVNATAQGDAGVTKSAAAGYLRPLLQEGRAPIAIVASSGEPRDIRRMDALLLDLFPANKNLQRWIQSVSKRLRFDGPPARVCWLAPDERSQLTAALDALVARGELKAPATLHDCDVNTR